MRKLHLVGMLCLLALSTAAFAASSASAALPEALGNVAGNTFTFTSGAGELVDLTTGLAIKCKKDSGSGTVTNSKELTSTVDFDECTIGGLAAVSLGDKSGLILVSLTGKLCYTEPTKKEVGILFTLPAGGLHLEVPSLGELLQITGSVVGKMTPVNSSTTAYTLSLADPNIKCSGATGKEDVLEIEKEHNGKPLVGSEVSTETITFAKTIEVMA
jgi:hypothetical protein